MTFRKKRLKRTKKKLIAIAIVICFLVFILLMRIISTPHVVLVFAADITVTIDTGEILHTNALQLGFQLDGPDISYWRGSSTPQELAEDANMQLVRFFYHRLGQPCTNWNEGSKSGSWDWTNTDDLVSKIFAIGAEPLIVLGFTRFDGTGISGLPSGMSTNSTTRLPEPEQWGAYCADWVEHFEDENLNVRYYEIINEPHHYFDWGGINTARRGYFGDVFNQACIDMRAENNTVQIGNDNSMIQSNNLNVWMANNLEDLNFLSWHPYLTGSLSSSDSWLISKARNDEGGTYGGDSFIDPARQDYYDENSVWLPVIQSEANLNYAWNPNEDPRMRQMLGAVTQAMRFQMYALNGNVTHSIYFHFAGGDTRYFGMVNRNTHFTYYPYYVHYMIGGLGELAVGDNIVEAISSSSDVEPLVWIHGSTTNILLINTVKATKTVDLSGVSGTYDYYKIDNSTSNLQSGTVDVSTELTFNGYTVMLLQGEAVPDTSPTSHNISHNTTIAGNPIEFACNETDDNALSGYIFGTNNTGIWTNETWTSLTGTQDWANVTKTLNSTVSAVVQYRWWCNDSIDQWGDSGLQSLTTTSINTPEYSNVGTNTNLVGENCTFHVQWSDSEGLSGYIFGTNNTGTWTNETWADPWSGTPLSGWSLNYKILNETVGAVVQWRVWANDTDDNWGDIGTRSFVLGNGSVIQRYPPWVSYDESTDTILLWGGGVGNLTWIDTYLHNVTLLNETSSKTWFLNASIFVDAWTHFEITAVDCDELRINSFTGNQRIIDWERNIVIANTTVYGWENNAVDTDISNGRSLFFSTWGHNFTTTNTTFGFLGNSSADALNIYYNNEYNTIIQNCTFHNSTAVYIRSNCTLIVDSTNFYDFLPDNCLKIYYCPDFDISDCVFDNNNATAILVYLSNQTVSTSKSISDIEVLNQQTNMSTIIRISDSDNVYLSDVTVDNCANNTVHVEWTSQNTTFVRLLMNRTGYASYTGFSVSTLADIVTVRDSTFYSIDRVSAKASNHITFDNCTVYGNHTSTYGFLAGTNSEIVNCHVYNITHDALSVYENSTIHDCYVEYADKAVIIHGGQDWAPVPLNNVTIRDNVFVNISSGGDAWSTGIGVASGATLASNILIENNTIEAGNIGILLYQGCENVTIENNDISLIPWGQGDAYCPVGYESTNPNIRCNRNNSDYRVNYGIGITRMLAVSWNWTIHGAYRHRNIVLRDNVYDDTYMQAYVWIDKGEPIDDVVLGSPVDTEGFSGSHYVFEFTDSYFNGSIIYANPDNPIYRYQRSNGTCEWGVPCLGARCPNIWYMSLNQTHFGTRVNMTAATPITWTYFWSHFNCSFSQIQQNDNTTRYLLLQDYAYPNIKSCADYEGYDAYVLVFNATADTGTYTTWQVNSTVFGEPTHVYINEVEDFTHWTFSGATNTTSLNWTHTSQVDFTITFPPLRPYPPENVDVIITDMEGCGNWVFAQEEYYTWQARYRDPNGYAQLDVMKMRFTDGLHWIETVYDGSDWSLENGSDVVRLKDGVATIIDPETLQVTFSIYLRNTILDAYDVDIYLWCNDTTGREDDWEIVADDYFNIYNLGGRSTIVYSGNAGRIIGGDVFDLYARNQSNTQGSWVEATMVFRHLQHIKMLPMITWLIENPLWNLTYGFDYCIDDEWVTGFEVKLDCYVTIANGSRYVYFETYWGNNEQTVKESYLYMHHSQAVTTGKNTTTQFWIDLWFNRQNASSIIAGRVNAYYFPMKDGSNEWLRWLTGNNWGIDEDLKKQDMVFDPITDNDGNLAHTQQIELIRIRCRLEVGAAWDISDTLVVVSDYDVFDLTMGAEPLTGIQTPVFDETKVPVMPQGGFLGTLASWLVGGIKWLGDNVVFGGLNLWGNFVGFMDTIASWLGMPGGFSLLISYVTSFWAWLGNSFIGVVSLLTSAWSFILTFLTKFLNTTSTAFTTFADMTTAFWSILGGTHGGAQSLWVTIRLDLWVQLFFIMYPVYLLYLWEDRGFDAVLSHLLMVKDVLAFMTHIFITVIQMFLRIIGRIIESVPIVE